MVIDWTKEHGSDYWRERKVRCTTQTSTCAASSQGVVPLPEVKAGYAYSVQGVQGSKNLFSYTRQGGSKRKVLVAKMAV